MPRPPKKTRSGAPMRSLHSGTPSIDRGLMRPEWKARLEVRAQERAMEQRQEGPASGPTRKQKVKKSKLWDPFKIWVPSQESIEAERAERERMPRFHEAIIPEAEREHVRSQEESWRRGDRAYERPAYERPASSPSSFQRPSGAYRPGPEPARRPQAEPIRVSPEYLSKVFSLEKMFDHVRQMRMDPKFRSQKAGGVGIISPQGMDDWGKVLKTAQFFSIPESELSRMPRSDVWDKLIRPFLSEVETVLNGMKPGDLPGSFRFESAPSGAFGLVYSER